MERLERLQKINQFHPLFIEGEILQRKTALFATALTQRLIITAVVKIWPKFRKFNPVSGKRPKLLIFFTTVTAVLTLANCVLFSLAFKSIFISFEVKKQLKMIHMTCQCFNKFNASVTKSKILFLNPSLENSLKMVFGLDVVQPQPLSQIQ